MKEFRYLSDVELHSAIISNELLTLVLVVKEGHSLCYLMESNLKKLSDKIRNKISIFKIDYKFNRDSVINYGIQTTPTLLLLKRGILIDKIEGLSSKKELISRIQHNL